MSVKSINNSTLKDWILDGKSNEGRFVVVDVRDFDYIGGNIKNSLHYPYDQFVNKLSDLIEKTKDIPVVIFHCALSQQRGPSSAKKYQQIIREQHKAGKIKGPLPHVYVLKGGFNEWQAKYGDDKHLTANYRKDIWRSGY